MTWATRITIFRLFLIPFFAVFVFLYLFVPGWNVLRWPSFGLFTLAAVTDFLDGYLARNFGQQSELGALLDPIADKCLFLASLVIMGFLPLFLTTAEIVLPAWIAGLIVGRDAILLTGYTILHKTNNGKVVVHPHWTGKLSTVAAFMAIGAVLLAWKFLILPLSLLSGALTIVSTCIYVVSGIHQLRFGPTAS